MLSVNCGECHHSDCHYAECYSADGHYADFHRADGHYADCHRADCYADCHYWLLVMQIVKMLTVIMLIVNYVDCH